MSYDSRVSRRTEQLVADLRRPSVLLKRAWSMSADFSKTFPHLVVFIKIVEGLTKSLWVNRCKQMVKERTNTNNLQCPC